MFDAVLFDLDGTFADTAPDLAATYRHAPPSAPMPNTRSNRSDRFATTGLPSCAEEGSMTLPNS